MQKKRRLGLAVIGLLLVLAILFTIVFATQTHETFLCRKSTTVKAGEIAVVSFYVPEGGSEEWIKYEFEVSQGTIKYMQFDPVAFQSNVSSVIEFMEKFDLSYDMVFDEPENGIGGFDFTKTYSMSGQVYDTKADYLDKTWDIFLYNEDSYDKEVTIDITKIWKLL